MNICTSLIQMKKVVDRFSSQSGAYRTFRPIYPVDLYQFILGFVQNRDVCWDAGTGNGQVAVALAQDFKTVFATDISENQLSHATQSDHIHYRVERAESTGFPADLFDLVTVAQAVHWFDIRAFNRELMRVVKNNGIVCVWGYSLPRISEPVNRIIDRFYSAVVGSYWDAERKWVEDQYRDLPLAFVEIPVDRTFEIRTSWKRHDLEGYLRTWSAVRNFIRKNGVDPVEGILENLRQVWPDEQFEQVVFPIFLRLGRIHK